MPRTAIIALVVGALSSACISQKRQTQAAARADLGVAYLKEGNVPGAIEILQDATSLDPRNWDAWDKLGLAYSSRGANEQAEEAWKQACRLAPEKAEVHNNYGQFLLRQGRTEEAIAHFGQALDDVTYRRPALVLSNLGFALYQTGKHEEALQHLDQAVHRAPNLCQARYHRGMVHEAMEDITEALEDYEVVISLCGDEALGAYVQAASLLIETGQIETACIYLKTAHKRAPESPIGKAAKKKLREACGP